MGCYDFVLTRAFHWSDDAVVYEFRWFRLLPSSTIYICMGALDKVDHALELYTQVNPVSVTLDTVLQQFIVLLYFTCILWMYPTTL